MSNYRSKYDVPLAAQYSTDSDCDYRDDDRSRYETTSEHLGGESVDMSTHSVRWRSYSEDSDSLQISMTRTADAATISTEDQVQEEEEDDEQHNVVVDDDWDDDSDAEEDYFNRDNGSITSRPSIANSNIIDSRCDMNQRERQPRRDRPSSNRQNFSSNMNKYVGNTYDEDEATGVIPEEEDDPTWASDDTQGVPPPPPGPPPEEAELVSTLPTIKPGQQHVFRQSSGSNRPRNPQQQYSPTSQGSSFNDFGSTSRRREESQTSQRDTHSLNNIDEISEDSGILELPIREQKTKDKLLTSSAPPVHNRRMAAVQKARQHSKAVAASGHSREEQESKRDLPISSSLSLSFSEQEQSVTKKETKTPERPTPPTTPRKSNRSNPSPKNSIKEEHVKKESPSSGKPPTTPKESPRRWKKSSPSTASESKDSKSTRFSFKRFTNRSKDKYAPPSPTNAESASEDVETSEDVENNNDDEYSKQSASTKSDSILLMSSKSPRTRKNNILPPSSTTIEESVSKVLAEEGENEDSDDEDWVDDAHQPADLKPTKSMFDTLTLDDSRDDATMPSKDERDDATVHSESNSTTVEEIEVVSGRIGDDMLKAIAEEEPEAIIEEVAVGSSIIEDLEASELSNRKKGVRRRSSKKTMKAIDAERRKSEGNKKKDKDKKDKTPKGSSRWKNKGGPIDPAEPKNVNVGELVKKPSVTANIGELNKKAALSAHVGELSAHVGELNQKAALSDNVGELPEKPKSIEQPASNGKPDSTTVNAVALPNWYDCNLEDVCKPVQEYLFPTQAPEQPNKNVSTNKDQETKTAKALAESPALVPSSSKKKESQKPQEESVDILTEMAKNPAPVMTIEFPKGAKKKINLSTSESETAGAATDECLTLASFSTITYDIPSPSRFQRLRSKRQEKKSHEDKLVSSSRKVNKGIALKKLLCSPRTKDIEFDDL